MNLSGNQLPRPRLRADFDALRRPRITSPQAVRPRWLNHAACWCAPRWKGAAVPDLYLIDPRTGDFYSIQKDFSGMEMHPISTTSPSTAAIDAAVPSLPHPWSDALRVFLNELELRRQAAARSLLRARPDAPRLGRPRKTEDRS